MLELLNNLVEILRDLLPNGNLKFHVWISRYLIVLFSIVGILYAVFFTFKDTVTGEKMGWNTAKVAVQIPTRIEFLKNNRNILGLLSNYRDENRNEISEIFLVALYNERANDFSQEVPESNNDLYIWAWGIPVPSYKAILNTEIQLNLRKEIVFNEKWDIKNLACKTKEVPKDLLNSLQIIYPDDKNKIKYYTMCPITSRSGKNIIALSLTFLNTSMSEAKFLAYTQNRLTIEINKSITRYTLANKLNSDLKNLDKTPTNNFRI